MFVFTIIDVTFPNVGDAMGVFPYLMWVGTYLLCVVSTLILVEMNVFSVCNVGHVKFFKFYGL
jgi:hypothetical protein